MKMDIRKEELRVFILISIILIIISVVSTIISWNFFHSEIEVPVYSNEESKQRGDVGFGILPKNESVILNSTETFDKGGNGNG